VTGFEGEVLEPFYCFPFRHWRGDHRYSRVVCEVLKARFCG
jgi:hypothetical protein